MIFFHYPNRKTLKPTAILFGAMHGVTYGLFTGLILFLAASKFPHHATAIKVSGLALMAAGAYWRSFRIADKAEVLFTRWLKEDPNFSHHRENPAQMEDLICQLTNTSTGSFLCTGIGASAAVSLIF